MAVFSMWSAMLMLLMSGGSAELLDFVPSKEYWQSQKIEMTSANMLAQLKSQPIGDVSGLIKQLASDKVKERDEAQAKLTAMGVGVLTQITKAADSPDAETSTRSKAIVESLNSSGKMQSVRRLMAIRALGELKDKQALPVLTGLLASKELFEAGYAAEAIAAIEGKPVTPTMPSADDMKSDLALLGSDCGLVGQAKVLSSTPMGIVDFTKQFQGSMPEEQIKQMSAGMIEGAIKLAHQTGNIRLDGVTIGLSKDIGPKAGGFVAIARGLYDPDAVKSAIVGSSNGRMKIEKVGDLEALRPDSKVWLLMPSAQRLVLVFDETDNVSATQDSQDLSGPRVATVQAVAAALKSGEGTLAQNKEMSALLNTVDQSGPLWVAAVIGPNYAQAPVLAPFRSIILSTKRDGDTVTAAIQAKGSDPNQTQGAVEIVQKNLDEARASFKASQEHIPSTMKPIGEAMESIKVQANGPDATLTAQFKGDIKGLLLTPFMGMQTHAQSEVRVHKAAPATAAEDSAGPTSAPNTDSDF